MNLHHETYMRRCLTLAAQGQGYVAPNPLVGAVLVHQHRIIGEGYHMAYGGPHAEVHCLNSVAAEHRPLIEKSTLYVSLEPCAHYGKTPPCADLIIQHRIPRVVIGRRDPFPAVNGKGIEKLQAAGVEVITGVLEQECYHLNRRFFCFHEKGRPYVVLKWAQTQNGFIGYANGERLYISRALSNRLVHRWRSQEQAILVGRTTALNDNPALGLKQVPGRAPLRMVIDRNAALPAGLRLFDGSSKTVVLNEVKEEQTEAVDWVQLPLQPLSEAITSVCRRYNVQSILVEGGRNVLQQLIDAGYWDEARVITATDLLAEGQVQAPVIRHATKTDSFMLQQDRIDIYHPNSAP